MLPDNNMLEQIFFFITNKCNIKCVTCYALEPLNKGAELDHNSKIGILSYFRQLGATKLSLLGGEPTLYLKLPDIISKAKEIGYSFVRINTNGLFNRKLLYNKDFKKLDLICFSIDGATNSINNKIRINSDLNTVIRNMRLAKDVGYEIRINSTITSLNIENIFDIIKLAEKEGVSLIYFNVVMLMGEALKNKGIAVSPLKWLDTYDRIVKYHNDFSVKIKIPPSFSSKENLNFHSFHGHKCIVEENNRLYISSNGDVFSSLVLMDKKDYSIGYFKDGIFNQVTTNFSNHSPYCKYLKCIDEDFYPLCIHYKTKLNY